MPLDVLKADLVVLACNGVEGPAPRRVDEGFDLMVKVLQRDDPLRRSYLQRRWYGYPTPSPLSEEVRYYNIVRTFLSPNALGRR
jgi:hypothetical protein